MISSALFAIPMRCPGSVSGRIVTPLLLETQAPVDLSGTYDYRSMLQPVTRVPGAKPVLQYVFRRPEQEGRYGRLVGFFDLVFQPTHGIIESRESSR